MIDFILHIDEHLATLTTAYPTLAYAFVFAIVFFETGVVLTPFLPGDSLLFATGALSATGSFHILPLFFTLVSAAILGDTVNYHIGKYLGVKIFTQESSRFFRKEHLARTEAFYAKHGKKTIIIARFIPIIRTFAPFIAGVGSMPYKIFLTYNIIGALLWCAFFIFGGYFFGSIPWIQKNFGLFVLAIIAVSLVPLIKEIISQIRSKKP